MDMCIIIPAAGIGKRMKSHGPKANIKIDEKNTVITRILSIIKKSFGKTETIVVLGFQKEKLLFQNNDPKVIVNKDFQNTNVSKSINIGISNSVSKDCLIIYGDIVFNKSIFSNFDFSESFILVEKNSKRTSEVGVNVIDGYAEHFSYGICPKWAHIVFLKEKDKNIFLRISSDVKTDKWFGFEILNRMIDFGVKLKVKFIEEIVEIDTYLDITKAKKFVKKNENTL
jgi:choline kinase